MHLDDGQLRAYLDGEFNDAAPHLAACPDCRMRLTALEAQARRVNARLSALAPQTDDPHLAARPALARFRLRRADIRKETSVFNQLFGRRARPVWAGLALASALAVALTFEPVRAWAGQFLGLFRVQQITVLPVDTTGLTALNDDQSLATRLGEMFSSAVKITREPQPTRLAASAEEAGQTAGFTVRLPQGRAPYQIAVQSGSAFEITVDRDQAQAILDEAGRSDLQLPASLDGARISVDIPDGVSTSFGDCPSLDLGAEAERDRIPWNRVRTCVILAQIPSPTVVTPPDLDVAQLAEIGLQFIGMSAEDAHDFSQTVDWTSTLVVPIPQNAASVEQVSVDGVTGTLLYRAPDDGWPARYTLLWVKDGIVFALTGFDDPQAGLDLANSLK